MTSLHDEHGDGRALDPHGGDSMPARTEPRDGEIAAWIDDVSAHGRAEAALRSLGSMRAAAALRAYLRRGAQSIPQPRCFAVAMLVLHLTADALGSVLSLLLTLIVSVGINLLVFATRRRGKLA